jgi:hypothetical protein
MPVSEGTSPNKMIGILRLFSDRITPTIRDCVQGSRSAQRFDASEFLPGSIRIACPPRDGSEPLQVREAKQITGRPPEIGELLDLSVARVSHLAQAAGLLHPVEHRLDVPALPLAQCVGPRVHSYDHAPSRIARRTPAGRAPGRDGQVRHDVKVFFDGAQEVPRFVTSIGAQHTFTVARQQLFSTLSCLASCGNEHCPGLRNQGRNGPKPKARQTDAGVEQASEETESRQPMLRNRASVKAARKWGFIEKKGQPFALSTTAVAACNWDFRREGRIAIGAGFLSGTSTRPCSLARRCSSIQRDKRASTSASTHSSTSSFSSFRKFAIWLRRDSSNDSRDGLEQVRR